MAFWLSFLFISLLIVNIEIHQSFSNSAGPDVVEELTYKPDSRKLVHGFSLKVQLKDLNMVGEKVTSTGGEGAAEEGMV